MNRSATHATATQLISITASGSMSLSAIPADEYPYLREMVVEYALKSGHDESADFGFGLDLILDGLQRVLDRTTS